MSSGLLALLDDVVALAKVAAASLDDAAAQAVKAGGKATGIVIDDAAVTPRYVTGLPSERELPIIGKIALGSLRNKLLFLLPGALALSLLAPAVITPLLMLGGLYLCFEGFEKLAGYFGWGHDHHDADEHPDGALSAAALEDEKVTSAIRTDFILSAEIMAITLATVEASPLATQAAVLAVVGVGMTALVYGAVALIVKADDAGLMLSRRRNSAVRALGRAVVAGMPGFLKGLSFVGMLAMLWVGGGIVVHGLHALGWHAPEDAIHLAAEAVAALTPVLQTVVAWLVSAGLAATAGAVLGALTAPLAQYIINPLMKRFSRA